MKMVVVDGIRYRPEDAPARPESEAGRKSRKTASNKARRAAANKAVEPDGDSAGDD